MQESNVKTMIFATIVTVVCAIILGATATSLKPQQELNAKVFKLKNIVEVFGLEAKTNEEIEAYFSEEGKDNNFIVRKIKNAKGEDWKLKAQKGELKDYTEVDPKLVDLTLKGLDLYKQEKLPVAERVYPYYLMYTSAEDKEADKPAAIVLPTQDFGLWSVCYGYLSLEADATTIKGIVYYDQKETPGLGAEIEQKFWKDSFIGKTIRNDKGDFQAPVASKDMDKAKNDPHSYISVSGATFTMVGIDKGLATTLKNYGPFINKYYKGGK